MAVRPVVITGDPVLHRPAAKVPRFDEDLRALVADM
jgi:peptide deformylase